MGPSSQDHNVEFMKSTSLEALLQALEQQPSVESKMAMAVNAMEKAISDPHAVDFKIFWEMRKKCMEFLRAPLPPVIRTQSWNQIAFLSQEARRIKKELEVESEFTKEQIEIAIQALETEISEEKRGEFYLAEGIDTLPEFNRHSHEYSEWQGTLDQLNLWVDRLTSLRKELMDAELRMRSKNLFFDKLSKLGDIVFPKRKQLIKEISHLFEKDVTDYINNRFLQKPFPKPPFQLKEEIKELQNLAKELALSSNIFSQTRLKLSAAWDQLKAFEQEKKEHFAAKKETFKENIKQLLEELATLMTGWEAKTLSLAEANTQLDALIDKGRALELGREEVYEWKKALEAFTQKLDEEETLKETEKKKREQERLLQKQQVMQAWRDKVEALKLESEKLEVKDLIQAYDLLLSEIQGASLNKTEKLELEKSFKPLKEKIRLKKEELLTKLPEDRLEALQQLQELSKQKMEEKMEIEELLEKFRKLAGSSGYDFTQALEYQQKLSEGVERRKEILASLEDINAKIDQISSS